MTARDLYQAGKLEEAVRALSAEVRDHPTDNQRRTFLFELLCFAGDFERAEKQLDVLAESGNNAQLGCLLYRSALHAERERQETFRTKEYPRDAGASEPGPVSGTLNGRPFHSLSDADPRIGPRLEIFAAGSYLWIPFRHIASIEIEPPKRLRDLIWIPALVRTGPSFEGRELGEILLPVLSPFCSKHADDQVRLGRATVWEEDEDGRVLPAGQKMLVADEEEFPLLELRQLHFDAPASAAEAVN
jgi:type VI secretion system protein ImpE